MDSVDSTELHMVVDAQNSGRRVYTVERKGRRKKGACRLRKLFRSPVMKQLIDKAPCTTTLPIRRDAFVAWHDFNLRRGPCAPAVLCDIVQVRQQSNLPVVFICRALKYAL
jgi:hypothetical protein